MDSEKLNISKKYEPETLEVIQFPNDILSQSAEEIESITPEITTLAISMVKTMIEQNGIGLAAPQVGKLVRLIVVMPPPWAAGARVTKPMPTVEILANPKILNKSGRLVAMEEGCLSIAGETVSVERFETITVSFLGLDNKTHQKTFTGLTARCIQHEIDHLNGITLVNYMNRSNRHRLSKRGKT